MVAVGSYHGLSWSTNVKPAENVLIRDEVLSNDTSMTYVTRLLSGVAGFGLICGKYMKSTGNGYFFDTSVHTIYADAMDFAYSVPGLSFTWVPQKPTDPVIKGAAVCGFDDAGEAYYTMRVFINSSLCITGHPPHYTFGYFKQSDGYGVVAYAGKKTTVTFDLLQVIPVLDKLSG